jgi:phosphatidylserine decarboxylase
VTFARWGIPTLFWVTLVLGWAVCLVPAGPFRWVMIAVAVFCWCFTLAFFRNPKRKPAGGPQSMIAPADGVVADIMELDEPSYVGERCVRIGIFLSVFDVHVNRSPCPATIRHAVYRPGAFIDARHPDVGHVNEANILGLEADASVRPGLKLLLTQLSGLIARRIISTHGVGDHLDRGELYGMIKFGSRTELWIPLSVAATVTVTVGDRVKCGETVIAEVPA